MQSLDQSPFVWVELNKSGRLLDQGAFARIKRAIQESKASDLVVLSHGWKNDRASALNLYEPLWRNTRIALNGTGIDPTKIVVAGIVWPSAPFRANFDEAALLAAAKRTALSIEEPPVGSGDLTEDELRCAIDDFLGGTENPEFRKLAMRAAEDLSAHEAQTFAMSAIERISSADHDPELSEDVSDVQHQIETSATRVLLGLVHPPRFLIEDDIGGGLSFWSDLARIVNGPRAAVARLLNQFSFYSMKHRAGVVGHALGSELNRELAGSSVRVHLVGHSFGARLVTAAANAMVPLSIRLHSLTLLQGAFSHNVFSSGAQGRRGVFADVVGRLNGPISITHTHNDTACTLLYALACRLVKDHTLAVGHPNDPYGSLGANGALNVTCKAHTGIPGSPSTRPRDGINNYLADSYIVGNPIGHDAHNDVSNPAIGQLLAASIRN